MEHIRQRIDPKRAGMNLSPTLENRGNAFEFSPVVKNHGTMKFEMNPSKRLQKIESIQRIKYIDRDERSTDNFSDKHQSSFRVDRIVSPTTQHSRLTKTNKNISSQRLFKTSSKQVVKGGGESDEDIPHRMTFAEINELELNTHTRDSHEDTDSYEQDQKREFKPPQASIKLLERSEPDGNNTSLNINPPSSSLGNKDNLRRKTDINVATASSKPHEQPHFSSSKRRLLPSDRSLSSRTFGNTKTGNHTIQSNASRSELDSTNKAKQEKFHQLMKTEQEANRQLDGLSTRYNLGVGKGQKYYDAMYKLYTRNRKLGLKDKKRGVMF
mmetsp:Transcript_6778/g.10903  ORF Transcript_6778/g.10903 Transcript_6778/m.10903 type:complete len:326 (+) Transcript_6778:1603-2580(+)